MPNSQEPREWKKGSPDFLSPVLDDNPSEWPAIPPELLATLYPPAVIEIDTPRGKEYLYNTQGVILPAQKAALEEIARSRWFLLANDGPDMERLKCGRCGRKHRYFTLACIERPFHGLQEIVALLQKAGKGSPSMQDMLMGKYVRLGTVVPISRKKALQLTKRIESTGERLN